MTSKTYISSSCFKLRKIDELLKHCQDNNWFKVELSGNLAFDEKTAEKLFKKKEFSFLVHNYFSALKQPLVLNLASSDQQIREKSIQHCQKAIKLSSDLKAPFYSVHAGFLMDVRPEDLGKKQSHLPFIDREKGFQLFKESIKELLDFMTKEKIDDLKLLIENNVNSQENLVNGENKLYLLADLIETRRFFDEINNSRLGLLVDLGHLNVSGKQLGFDKHEFIETLKDKIKAFHLSENNGAEDQALAFSKTAWFIPLLKQPEFKEMVKIIEINKTNSDEDLLKCVKVVN